MKHRIVIIVILLCLIPFCFKITYSLFTSSTSLIANSGIAEFIFNAKRTNHIELEFDNLKSGEEREYEFQVSNTKDNNVTNVTTEYKITLKTFHFMPLLIELYKNDELVMTCDEDYSRNRNTDNALVCNSDIWQLEHDTTKTDNFKIKISFPKEYNSLEYTELVDYIDIDISSWQKIK